MSVFQSVDAVAAYLTDLPFIPSRRFVALTGAPGAGKSTVAAALVARLPSSALLPMDGFHLPQARLRELGLRERMGAHDTFDVDAFLLTLADLEMSGGPVFAPGFDRSVEEPVPDSIVIQPEVATVVVEGNYLLHDAGGWEKAGRLFDETFFVEVPDPIRRHRLIDRHVRYGKRPAEAEAWALGTDEENARLIAATASRADHLIRLD